MSRAPEETLRLSCYPLSWWSCTLPTMLVVEPCHSVHLLFQLTVRVIFPKLRFFSLPLSPKHSKAQLLLRQHFLTMSVELCTGCPCRPHLHPHQPLCLSHIWPLLQPQWLSFSLYCWPGSCPPQGLCMMLLPLSWMVILPSCLVNSCLPFKSQLTIKYSIDKRIIKVFGHILFIPRVSELLLVAAVLFLREAGVEDQNSALGFLLAFRHCRRPQYSDNHSVNHCFKQ